MLSYFKRNRIYSERINQINNSNVHHQCRPWIRFNVNCCSLFVFLLAWAYYAYIRYLHQSEIAGFICTWFVVEGESVYCNWLWWMENWWSIKRKPQINENHNLFDYTFSMYKVQVILSNNTGGAAVLLAKK